MMPPIIMVIAMQIVILVWGGFMDPVAIPMITLPIFVPFTVSMGSDPVWFATIVILNIELAMVSPPFGLTLFVMKGVTRRHLNGGYLSIRFPLPRL